jgi:hypothetical protein
MGKSVKIPWFQSPPSSLRICGDTTSRTTDHLERLALGIMGHLSPTDPVSDVPRAARTRHAKHVTDGFHLRPKSFRLRAKTLLAASAFYVKRQKNIWFKIFKSLNIENQECWYSSFELIMKLSHLAMTRKNLGRCRHKWHYKWHYKWHHFWIILPHNLEVTDMCWWYLIPIFISQVTRIPPFFHGFVRPWRDRFAPSCMSAASSWAPNGSAILRTFAGRASHGRDHFWRRLDTDPSKKMKESAKRSGVESFVHNHGHIWIHIIVISLLYPPNHAKS